MKTDPDVLSTDAPQCDRCGRCLSVCPVYSVSHVETDSPRGRTDLTSAVASGELNPGPRFFEAVDRCLLCRSCAVACPKGVDTAANVLAARAEVSRPHGPGARLGEAAMDALIPHRSLMSACVRTAGVFSRMLPADKAGRRHFPEYLPQMLSGRGVPPITGRPLQKRLPSLVPRSPGSPNRGRAVFFTGCFYGLVDSGPGLAAVKMLCDNGFDVLIPPDQQCCGAPALFSGRLKSFKSVLRKNLRALGAAEGPVITACPTCASVLRGHYPEIAARMGGPEAEQATSLGPRVQEALTFLAGLSSLSLPGSTQIRSAAVHQPCHFVHAGGDPAAVADLMHKRGVELVMNGETACCGGGGVSSLKNPDLARELGSAAAGKIAASGAEVASAACPGCVLQIGSHLGKAGSNIPAIHPLEILCPIR